MAPAAIPTWAVLLALALGTAAAPLAAVEKHLPAQGVDDAITFARMALKDARQAFHQRYLRTVGGTVFRLSIISEYRRVVLRTEERIRLGDRGYGVRQMTTDLEPWRGQVEVVAELHFDPRNSYVGVPLIDILLVPLDDPGALPLIAAATDRIPKFGALWDPPPFDTPWWPFPPAATVVTPRAEPVTGGWVLARFDAEPLASGRYDVVVKEGGTTLGHADFDFGALR